MKRNSPWNARRFAAALALLSECESAVATEDFRGDAWLAALDSVVIAFFSPPGKYRSWGAWVRRVAGREEPGMVLEWLACNHGHLQRTVTVSDIQVAVSVCEDKTTLINLITAIREIADAVDNEFIEWAQYPTLRLIELELTIQELMFVVEYGVNDDFATIMPTVRATEKLVILGHYPGEEVITEDLFLISVASINCDWQKLFAGVDSQERTRVLMAVARHLEDSPEPQALRSMRDALENI